jgi:protein-tyrosine-phosphatase
MHPSAVRALAEYGIALEHEPTHVDTLLRRRFHLVITLCDREREVCPEFPGRPETIHWGIPDPADQNGNSRQTQQAFRRVAAELDDRIRFLRIAIAGLSAAAGHC